VDEAAQQVFDHRRMAEDVLVGVVVSGHGWRDPSATKWSNRFDPQPLTGSRFALALVGRDEGE
jgi:hypothetical protein